MSGKKQSGVWFMGWVLHLVQFRNLEARSFMFCDCCKSTPALQQRSDLPSPALRPCLFLQGTLTPCPTPSFVHGTLFPPGLHIWFWVLLCRTSCNHVNPVFRCGLAHCDNLGTRKPEVRKRRTPFSSARWIHRCTKNGLSGSKCICTFSTY